MSQATIDLWVRAMFEALIPVHLAPAAAGREAVRIAAIVAAVAEGLHRWSDDRSDDDRAAANDASRRLFATFAEVDGNYVSARRY